MKKNLITIKDFTTLQDKIGKAKKQLRNSLTEDADDLRKSLEALLDELANAEIEYDFEALKEAVNEMIASYNGEMPEEVANAIKVTVKNAFVDMQKTMPQSEKLTPKIKNQIAAAVLRAKGKEAVKDAVDAVLVKNGISGLTFNDVIDFAVVDNWGDSDELFAALKKVRFSKFFYDSHDFNDPDVVAHGWDKTSETEKAIQQLTANGKKIGTDYVYKRQQFAFVDLDEIEESGEGAVFLRWVNEELDRQIINSIVAVILGNTTDFTDITTFESLLGTGVTDVFRTAVTVTDATAITFTEARAIADAVRTGIGAKWMVMSQTQLTGLAKFKYASGGDDIFRSKEEVAAMLGVDRIYVTDKATALVCFVPSEYWWKEKKALQVVYPKYENNVMNYQRERNCGGAIHGLKTVAFGVEG